MYRRRINVGLLLCFIGATACAGEGVHSGLPSQHPRLLISAEEVGAHAGSWQQSKLFSAAIESARERVDAYFASPPDVPAPRDAGGGYTHEQHKRNATAIHDAGMLYLWTGETAYAAYARDLLLAYAKLYPGLGEHPRKKEQTPGRLFWQSLNEAWWLVHTVQGYDAVYHTLSAGDRRTIENDLLREMADFLSVGQPQTFDKIHNHGTWATAAVGMTGYAIDEPAYVEKALLGLGRDGSAGFVKQLDELFSPDGYYTEGPYYQRYALMPFVVFGKSIARNEPGKRIFEYRDEILKKAIYTTIQLTYAGRFFPINDAIKDKGLDTKELDYAIAIAHGMTSDRSLLSLIGASSDLVLTADGLGLALAREQGLETPFVFRSMQLRDGAHGDRGALTILRSGYEEGHTALVFKATSQGMGHGHFDRLNWIYYDNGYEVVTDYGAARFLNVVQKFGGHYLPENASWAKQTVAHNTLVVDQTSHFDAEVDAAEKHAPGAHYFDNRDGIQLASAREDNAYAGVSFDRTVALIDVAGLAAPLMLDVLRARSGSQHQYDLPMYYSGHLIDSSLPLRGEKSSLVPVGSHNGYQHLWKRAQADLGNGERFALTWLLDNRFYTYSVLADTGLEVMLTEVGANDPDFNLRHEPGLLLRAAGRSDITFVNVLEAHGEYNGSREYTIDSASQIAAIDRVAASGKELVRVEMKNGASMTLALSYDPDPRRRHSMTTSTGDVVEWSGFYRLWREGSR